MTQPDMAKALDISLSAYTHYEASADKLTVDRLMQLDGKISMLEKVGGKPVDKSVGKKTTRIQDLLPHTLKGINPQPKSAVSK